MIISIERFILLRNKKFNLEKKNTIVWKKCRCMIITIERFILLRNKKFNLEKKIKKNVYYNKNNLCTIKYF